MTKKVSLLFGVHAHQPAGNFEEVIDDAHARCYKPFLETVYGYPAVQAVGALQRLAAGLSAQALSGRHGKTARDGRARPGGDVRRRRYRTGAGVDSGARPPFAARGFVRPPRDNPSVSGQTAPG